MKNLRTSKSMRDYYKAKSIISLCYNYIKMNQKLKDGIPEGISKKDWREYKKWVEKESKRTIEFLSHLYDLDKLDESAGRVEEEKHRNFSEKIQG